MDRSATILVVGAGPVGLAAAIELKRRGFEPRIVDRGEEPTPPDQSRALAVLPTTLEVLGPSGLAAIMLEEGQRVERFRIMREGKTLFTLRAKGARTPCPFILSLPQGRTERLMIDWLAERGTGIGWNTELVALDETGGQTTATFADGTRIAADVVIGCDGIHSAVRTLSGIGWTGEGYAASFALADVRFTRPVEAGMVKADLKAEHGATAFFPMSETVGRFIGIAPSTELLLAGFTGVEEVVWASQFEVSFQHAERMAAGNRFLAGDAAHVHSPVGGRGMNLGIWDAATLAFLLAEGREGEYEAVRLPVAKEILGLTRNATDFLVKRSRRADLALRYLLPFAVNLPFLQRRIAERLLALDLPPLEWLRAEGALKR